jgi:recombination protein RecA
MARQKLAAAQAAGKDRLAALRKVASRFKSLRPATEALTRVRAVPTIFPQFDVAVGVGGFPIERFSLVHGQSSHGKSKAVLGLCASFLALDHFALYIDAERTTAMDWVETLLGKELANHPGFLAKRPETYEQTIADVREFCLGIAKAKEDEEIPPETSALIVIDSIRKLVPENIWEKIQKDKDGDIGRRSAQIKAAMNSNWLDELIPLLEKSGAGMAVIARETEDPDADIWSKRAGTDYKVGGGAALLYDASLGIRVERAGWVQEGEGKDRKVYGERHRMTIHKTKVSGREDKVIKAYFHASNGVLVPEGFDRPRDVLELAEQHGVVEKKGSWLWHQGEKIGNGSHKAVQALHANPEWAARLEVEARAAATANKDGEVP